MNRQSRGGPRQTDSRRHDRAADKKLPARTICAFVCHWFENIHSFDGSHLGMVSFVSGVGDCIAANPRERSGWILVGGERTVYHTFVCRRNALSDAENSMYQNESSIGQYVLDECFGSFQQMTTVVSESPTGETARLFGPAEDYFRIAVRSTAPLSTAFSIRFL